MKNLRDSSNKASKKQREDEKTYIKEVEKSGSYRVEEKALKDKLKVIKHEEMIEVFEYLINSEEIHTNKARTLKRSKKAHLDFIHSNKLTNVYIDRILLQRDQKKLEQNSYVDQTPLCDYYNPDLDMLCSHDSNFDTYYD